MAKYILGVRGHDYGMGDIKTVFSSIKKDGWDCTQLAIKKLMTKVKRYEDVSPEVVIEIQRAIIEEQLEIAVLGTYVELGALDIEQREAAVRDFVSQIPICKALGASCIASETTYYNPSSALVSREEALKELLKSLDAIMPVAEQYDVTVALETVGSHTMNTIETTCQVINYVKSPNLKLIFDPVNMLGKEWYNCQSELYYRVVENWGDLIAAVHLKGMRYMNGAFVSCGLAESTLDYAALFKALNTLPQERIPILREGAIPELAKVEQKLIESYFY